MQGQVSSIRSRESAARALPGRGRSELSLGTGLAAQHGAHIWVAQSFPDWERNLGGGGGLGPRPEAGSLQERPRGWSGAGDSPATQDLRCGLGKNFLQPRQVQRQTRGRLGFLSPQEELNAPGAPTPALGGCPGWGRGRGLCVAGTSEASGGACSCPEARGTEQGPSWGCLSPTLPAVLLVRVPDSPGQNPPHSHLQSTWSCGADALPASGT